MTAARFFGYGSLVNLRTHDYHQPRTATLRGWRRVWKGTQLREVAYLSVERDEASTLHGVLAEVPNGDWAALDAREAAYDRHDVTPMVGSEESLGKTVVYQVSPSHVAPDGDHPILLSYVDVVVQGYLQLFGPSGVAHFFETTQGWHLPILDDRADPIYPRHQRLAPEERALVDRHLAAVVK